MQRVGGHRLRHLFRELAQLLGMLLDVLRPLIANRAQCLARETPADHGVVLVRTQQRVLVSRDRARFGSRDEARAEPDAVGSQRDRGREPAPVEDAARGDDRYSRADLVDDLRDERHRGDGARMTARLGALRDHEVAARFDRRDRVAHLAAHAGDEDVAVVQDLDDVARNTQARNEQRRPAGHDLVRVVEHALGKRGEELHRGLGSRPPPVNPGRHRDSTRLTPTAAKPPAPEPGPGP